MSEILNLAKGFEANLKEQASNTRERVSNALLEHEQTLKEELRLSEQRLMSDMLESQLKLRNMALSTWKWLLLSILAVLLVAMTGLLATGYMVSSNIEKIAQQRQTLKQLNAKGIELVSQKLENGKVQTFLVLSNGQTFGNPFKSKAGQQVVEVRK